MNLKYTKIITLIALLALIYSTQSLPSAQLHDQATPTLTPSQTLSPAPIPTLTLTSVSAPIFNSQRAYQDIAFQVSLGPRTIGSEAHVITAHWIMKNLQDNGWAVELQEHTWANSEITNVVARRGEGVPWVILGAHYDSRFVADQDPDPEKRTNPVPGANDGASGVAVLLELARVLPLDLEKQIWLVFFDAEDNGDIPHWDWIVGSRMFVGELVGNHPDAVVIIDMVGDADLNIYTEKNSDPDLSRDIWNHASGLGYYQFIPWYRYRIVDDHLPFIEAGIKAVDIIDFDYPYWHTTEDTLDKVSAQSLLVVGETLLSWLNH